MTQQHPLLAPIYAPGSEPYPPGTTEQEKEDVRKVQKWTKQMNMVMESCPTKVVMAGGMGFLLGGFFAMMSASFAIEDPMSRASQELRDQGMKGQAKHMFKEMARNMWTSGKGFAKVGALYSGTECCIEAYRAKNDIWNSVAGGFLSGAILARNAGPKAMVGGGLAFAGFSAAIDLWLRKAPAEEP